MERLRMALAMERPPLDDGAERQSITMMEGASRVPEARPGDYTQTFPSEMQKTRSKDFAESEGNRVPETPLSPVTPTTPRITIVDEMTVPPASALEDDNRRW